ncbi:hypothetical protein SCUP234_03633 [Seiridium cupressi]
MPRLSFHQHDIELHGVQLNLVAAIGILLSFFSLYGVGVVIYRLWFHPLRRLPGPKLQAITDLPAIYTSYVAGTSIHRLTEFHRKYGPIVRIGPNRLALDGSVGWPQVFARRSGGEAEYEKAPGVFSKATQKSIIASPHDVHRRQRRQMGHAFSEVAMREQEALISRYVELLVERVESRALAGEQMDIVQWLNFTTFDIIGDLTFGESFGSLQSSTYHPWVLSIFSGIKGDNFVRACNHFPLISSLLVRLFGDQNVTKGDDFRELIGTKGKKRMELDLEPNGRRDFTTYMLQKTRDGNPGLSTTEIISNMPLLTIAGSETTATALSGFFFYVNNNPRVKDIIIREIRDAFKDASEINFVTTNSLEYLHAALEETLRVYPPAAATPARASPGAFIEGTYVPKGTVVHVSQWATFRNPEHFAEPDSFCPERWLKSTHPLYDSKFENDNRSVFKPFSAGPRDCIGKNLAYAEMRLIVTKLLYKFDVELLPGQEKWHAVQNAYLIWDKGPLYVRFTPRKAA